MTLSQIRFLKVWYLNIFVVCFQSLGKTVLGYETGECFVGDSRGEKGGFFEGRFSAEKVTKPCELQPPAEPEAEEQQGGMPAWAWVLTLLGSGAVAFGAVFGGAYCLTKKCDGGKKGESEADGRGSYASVSGKDKDVENASDSDSDSDAEIEVVKENAEDRV